MSLRIALPLLLLCTSAFAQTPASDEPETVYSEAERDRSISQETLNAVLEPVEGVEEQYARWKKPVCVNVYGLAMAAKYVVERRIRDVGEQVGAPMDRRDPCVPNVTIAFTTDPAATLKSIHDARPGLLPNYDFIAARVKQSQSIQAWYGISLQGASGREELQYDGFNEERPQLIIREFSRLNSGVSTALQTVMIVVDTSAIMGKTLGTLADHFAVMALAQGRATRRCKTVPTIANLMHEDCDATYRPGAITANDLALLTGLYKTPDNTMQRLQRVRIIGNMRKALEGRPVH